MPDRLLDTTVWIDHTRGRIEAAEFLQRARSEGRVACSIINVLEITVNARGPKERRIFNSLFKAYEVLPVVEEDGWQALRLVNAYPGTGIGILDAFLAAAAIRERLTLTTSNEKHFRRIAGLKVERPY